MMDDNKGTENLLMETAMCIMEKYIELESNGALDSDKTEIDSLIRLQDFCDMAREFEEKYRGTEEYDNDFYNAIDEFSAEKILEKYGADKEEKEEDGIEREDRLMEIAMCIMDQYTCMSDGDLIDVDAVEEEMAVAGGFQLFCRWAREFAENHPDIIIIHDEVREFAKRKLIDLFGNLECRNIEVKTTTEYKMLNTYCDIFEISNSSEYSDMFDPNGKLLQSVWWDTVRASIEERDKKDLPVNAYIMKHYYTITDKTTGMVIREWTED